VVGGRHGGAERSLPVLLLAGAAFVLVKRRRKPRLARR
jgi:LPXTG-motif cell wall-anchored protein